MLYGPLPAGQSPSIRKKFAFVSAAAISSTLLILISISNTRFVPDVVSPKIGYSRAVTCFDAAISLQQLENNRHEWVHSSRNIIDAWAGVHTPMASLAAKEAEIPVFYPEFVQDRSGNLERILAPSQLAQMQKPRMKIAQGTQKLACTCATCEPKAPPGFPPICSDCTCQEAIEHPDVYILGYEQPCGAAGCDKSDKKKNAMHDWPQCARWACYNKDGWFCACTCPGPSCPQPSGGWF
jgi:hypothetical protein